MKLNFIIDEDYFIHHILSSMKDVDFSSNKYRKDIVSLQNFAWSKSRSCYGLLSGRIFPGDLSKENLMSLPSYINSIKKSKPYAKVLRQTEEYLLFCKKQWEGSFSVTSRIIMELTGLKLTKSFTVYITHPSLKQGRNLGNNRIAWGHKEEFKNYTTIYLWHEALHSYLDKGGDLQHALIELVTDEELRKRLNKINYPPFIGHKKLSDLKKRILPYWKRYLREGAGNIKKFENKIRNIVSIRQEEKK